MSTFIGEQLLSDGTERKTINTIIDEAGLRNTTVLALPGTVNGDNYSGTVVALTITGTDYNDSTRTLQLMLKYSSRTGALLDFLPTNTVYCHEVYMYRDFLPEIYKLQTHHKIKHLFPVAKMFKYSLMNNDEHIIFQNMKSRGFYLPDRRHSLDFNHCRLVCEQLGHYHALNFVLKTTQPVHYDQLATPLLNHPMCDLNKATSSKYIAVILGRAIATLDPVSEPIVFKRINKVMEYCFDYFFCKLRRGETFDKQYSIVNHGDCWNNNLLFKYDGHGKPYKLCFLDWQLSFLASPVMDLSYFIYINAGPELLDEDGHTDLLEIYYNALVKTIDACGFSASMLYPRHVFTEHVQRYFGYGVPYACIALPMTLSEANEIPDVNKFENLNEQTFDQFNFKSQNNDNYVRRMRAVLMHAVRNNYITDQPIC